MEVAFPGSHFWCLRTARMSFITRAADLSRKCSTQMSVCQVFQIGSTAMEQGPSSFGISILLCVSAYAYPLRSVSLSKASLSFSVPAFFIPAQQANGRGLRDGLEVLEMCTASLTGRIRVPVAQST